MAKHIFIGLGGSGVNTVAPIKYKVYERTQPPVGKSRLEIMAKDYRFMFVDTDDNAVKTNNIKYRELFENGRMPLLEANRELVDMGILNPSEVYRNAKNGSSLIDKRICESCDDETRLNAPVLNDPLRHGAGAIRHNSRLAFARALPEFSRRLRANIEELHDIIQGIENERIVYWVVSSCNGGTGSGILNDVLFYINMVHKSIFGEGDPNIVLTLYMPQIFINKNEGNEKYPFNAMAAMKELEQLKSAASNPDDNLNKMMHRLALVNDKNFDNYHFNPFNFCIPVDHQTSSGNMLGDLPKVYSNTSELLYYIHNTKSIFSFNVNYDEFLSPMGYIALRKPVKHFEDYMELRLQYELMKYGIVGKDIEFEKKNEVIQNAYTNFIHQPLFENTAGSVYKTLLNIVDNAINDDFLPDSCIANERGKINSDWADVLSLNNAGSVIRGIEQKMQAAMHNKKQVLEQIDSTIWALTNKTVVEHGYRYAWTLLKGLDDICTDKTIGYLSDTGSELALRRKITSEIEKLQGQFEEELEKAGKRKLLGINQSAVQSCFAKFKKYIRLNLELKVMDYVYDLLNELCVDDKGLIDHVILYVSSMLNEALTAENKCKLNFDGLQKAFSISKLDVTSVFLPEVEKFVTVTGWQNEHLFAELYKQIIAPSSTFVADYGYEPSRNSGAGSLMSFIETMCTVCRSDMMTKGFISANGDNNLFINRKIDNFKLAIDHVRNYASIAVKKSISGNEVIKDRWLNKTLASFIDNLDNDALSVISKRMTPTLFFPYDLNKHRPYQETKIFVAPQETAERLLGYQQGRSNQELEEITLGTFDDTIYSIIANVGMSFDFYIPFPVLKRLYDACEKKKYYHFHKAVGESSGEFLQIQLPYEPTPQKMDFVRFLIMYRYEDDLKNAYLASDSPMDRDRYCTSPIQIGENMATILKYAALSEKDGKIALDKGGGAMGTNFVDFQITPGNPYSDVYKRFLEIYHNEQLSKLITDLIGKMKRRRADVMLQKFNQVIAGLKNQMSALWTASDSDQEKELLREINEILNTDLSKYDNL